MLLNYKLLKRYTIELGMKRFFKIFSIVALLGATGFAAWWFLFPSKNVNGLNLIPQDAIYVIHSDRPIDNWNQLSNSAVWKFLKQHPTFAEITEYADYLDNLIKENQSVFNLVGKRDLFISAHKTKAKDYDFLFAIDLKKAAGVTGLKTALQVTFEQGGYKVTTRNHRGDDILEVYDPKAKDVLYLTTIGNFIVGSYTSQLVEHSLEQYNEPYLARENKFTELMSLTDDQGIGKIYVNYNYIDDYMNCYLSSPNEMVNDMSKILRFSSAYFAIDDEKVEANGYTNLNDSLDSYMRALMLSGKGENNAPDVLSNRTAIYMSFGFKSINEFKTNLTQVLKGSPQKELEFNNSISKIEKLLKISVDDHLLSWIGHEVAYVQNKPSKYNSSEDDIIIAMQADDIELAKQKLGFVHKQVKKRTPAKFKSMTFKNHEINYLEIKGFFRVMFGKLFNKLQKPYYTTIGNYVLFSNNPKTLVGLIMDYEDGKTLAEEEDYVLFRNKFDKESSLFCYLSSPRLFPLLQKQSSAESWKSIRESKKYITSFSHAGFQLTSAGDKFKTQLLLQFKEDKEEEDREESMVDSTFKTEAFDITRALDSLDEADWFILKKIEKGVYKKKYDNSEQIEIEAETDDGILDGNYKEYHANGELRVDGQYRNGRKTGTWKIYTSEGNLEEKIKYKRR